MTQQGSPRRESPYFSVVVAARNRADVVLRSLESILSQDFADVELIAVDDCSQDNTLEAMRTVRDPRLRIVEAKEYAVCGGR